MLPVPELILPFSYFPSYYGFILFSEKPFFYCRRISIRFYSNAVELLIRIFQSLFIKKLFIARFEDILANDRARGPLAGTVRNAAKRKTGKGIEVIGYRLLCSTAIYPGCTVRRNRPDDGYGMNADSLQAEHGYGGLRVLVFPVSKLAVEGVAPAADAAAGQQGAGVQLAHGDLRGPGEVQDRNRR